MLKYNISFFILLISFISFGQQTYERKPFIRFGAELTGIPSYFIFDVERFDFSLTLDTEIKTKYYPIIEAGWNQTKGAFDNFNYKSEGVFFKAGMNKNLLKNLAVNDRTAFIAGVRYAYSNYAQQYTNISLAGNWGNIEGVYDSGKLNAHWMELVIGMQGEITKNLSLGYTVRVKQKVFFDDFGTFVPYMVPGYGRGNRNLNIGFNYYVSYAFPMKQLFKKKNEAKRDDSDKENTKGFIQKKAPVNPKSKKN